MKLYTIGFTKKSAHDFFETLRSAGVARIVDVRLNNVSQLAGFTKKQDFPYFLEQITGTGYAHAPVLAPTQELLDSYKKLGTDWPSFEASFISLMRERRVETGWADRLRDSDCLLCSEEKPAHCHRRLVAEYLAGYRSDIEIRHIGLAGSAGRTSRSCRAVAGNGDGVRGWRAGCGRRALGGRGPP